MKQLFIGLLIVAAGAGAYYFLQSKNNHITSSVEQHLLTGRWKIDSVQLPPRDSASFPASMLFRDSSLRKSIFEFQKTGAIIQTTPGSTLTDSAYYTWKGSDQLLIKQTASDSSSETFFVNRLNADSLIIQGQDSVLFVLRRL